MARMRQWIGLAALSLSLAGCVPQEKYAALKLDDDQLREQLGQAQSEANSEKNLADARKQQLDALTSNGTSHDAIVKNLMDQNANLQQQLDALNQKYADAINKLGSAGTSTALPPVLSNALSEFARQNPDLVDFDAARGIVKFKSDVTFAVGDATVTPKAKEVLSKFAAILNSSGASEYELLVAGHTDNTPVVNPETIRKGHKNNWYLSAHRAITVAEELIGDGVSSRRLGAVGYADMRPAASNGSEEGKQRNRRVEVLILPTTVHDTAGYAGDSAPVHHHKAAPAVLNKDASPAADHSSLNK